MKKFRKEALEDFVNTTDGDRPPVYIGRGDILNRIEGYANASWKGQGAPIHGVGKATTVVQGAPGAGKSALIDELKARSNSIRAHLPDQSRVVTFSSQQMLSNFPGVLRTIGLAAGWPADRWRDVSANFDLNVDLEIFRAGGGLSWLKSDPVQYDSIDHLAEGLPAKKWQGPVIVCIDEAQRLPEDRYAPHALFLQAIHDGRSTLPLSLVLGGLGNTADVADGMGLTRLSVREIGALSTEPDPERGGYVEVMDLMLGFCHHFGIGPAGQENRLIALAAPCEGWPRHLHFALQALGRGLLETEGDLATVDWPRITQEAAESRLDYYRLQQSGKMKDANILVARIMRDFRNGMDNRDVAALIMKSVEDSPGMQLPENLNALSFRKHLVRKGALHKDIRDTFLCPIPSFRTFLVKAGGLDPDLSP